MNNIVLGFLLTGVTLNFFGLQYILPTLGAGLLYIGFYDLRNENKALKVGWIFSIVNMVINVLNLIYISTPLSISFKSNWVIIFILTVFHVAFLLVFRNGIKKAFKKVDKKPNRDPLLWAVIWRGIVIICVVTQLGSIWVVFIPLIIFYFCIYRSLYFLCDDLREIIYGTSEHYGNLRKKIFILVYMIGCAFLVAICCVVANHIRLEATEFNYPNTSEVRNNLIDKGFPEDILRDISDDEVEKLKDAVYVDSSSELLMFDERKEVVKDKYSTSITGGKPGEINLDATTIYVELDNNKLYAVEYFKWRDKNTYWNDGFTINSGENLELISGRLLYNKRGSSFYAPIPRLKNEILNESDWFGNSIACKNISGAINYPFGSERQRGYVFYQIYFRESITFGSNIVNYTHYKNPFRVPYSEPENNGSMFNDRLRQHVTNFMTKDRRENYE